MVDCPEHFVLLASGLESVDLGVLFKVASKLKEFLNGLGKIIKEALLVLGVDLGPLAELLVLHHGHICGQHHQRPRLLVLELLRTIPLALNPVATQELSVEIVGEDGGRCSPRTIETRAVRVAASQSVSAQQSDNLLIVEAHLVKDVARVLTIGSGGIGKTTIGGGLVLLTIDTASSPVDGGTTLNSFEQKMGHTSVNLVVVLMFFFFFCPTRVVAIEHRQGRLSRTIS